jgi:acyl-CoA thioester hydrolase
MTADQTIHCGGTRLVHGRVEACIITLSGKPRRIPEATRERLLPLLCETEA